MTRLPTNAERDGLGFTPGPWRIGKAGPNLCPTVGTLNGLMVCMVAHGDDHPTEANACLIAAAPDLYAALDELYGKAICGTDEERHDALNDAWAALAKARGDA